MQVHTIFPKSSKTNCSIKGMGGWGKGKIVVWGFFEGFSFVLRQTLAM